MEIIPTMEQNKNNIRIKKRNLLLEEVFMTHKSLILGLTLVFILGSTGILIAFSEDLSGSWSGSTVINGMDETLTLVLKKSDDNYTGMVTDSAGFSNETEIESVKFENNQLSFTFPIDTGGAYMTIYVTLEVSKNEMTGEWTSDDGGSGPIKLKKE